jgi:putative endonuclease
MTESRQRLGRWGETLACRYLAERGYTIVARNVRTPYGEIDIIASQPDGSLVFVEVKTRRSAVFGPPEVSVTTAKKAHLLASIQSYLVDHPDFMGEYRLDVIAIQSGTDNQPPEIVHFENAIV